MPLISQFFGVVIKMYFDDNSPHHTPRFHARYAGKQASFDLDGNLLVGDLPRKQIRLIQAWTEIHRDELTALWEETQNDGVYFTIRGLE